MTYLDHEELLSYANGIDHRGHVDPGEVSEVVRKAADTIQRLKERVRELEEQST